MFDGKYYQEMLGITEEKFKSKPIKIVSCNPSALLKMNKPLVLSHLTYKFLISKENILIPPIIHKPKEVIEQLKETNNFIDLGNKMASLILSRDKIYGIIFCEKNLSSVQVASVIVSGYDVFSQLLVTCKIRFISRDPVYVVFEKDHSYEIVVSLRDIISKYGITNDTLYKRRLEKAFMSYYKMQEEKSAKVSENDDKREDSVS